MTLEAFLEVGGPSTGQRGGFTGVEQGRARQRPKQELLVATVPQAERGQPDSHMEGLPGGSVVDITHSPQMIHQPTDGDKPPVRQVKDKRL